MALSSEIIAKLGLDVAGFQQGLATAQNQIGQWSKSTAQEIGGVSRGVETLRKVFMLGGVLTAMKGFFTAAIEHARAYQGEIDSSIEATKRFADKMEELKGVGAKVGVEVIGWVEKAGFGLASLVYGVDAAADAYNEMDAAARKALDDERTQKLTAAKEQLAKITRDIAFAEADSNGKVNILLKDQIGIRERLREAGAETVEGQQILGELLKNEAAIRKVVGDIAKDEAKSVDEKAKAEKAASEELEKQKKSRDELVAKIQKEKIEIEAKVAAETDTTIKAANAAAGRQGFEKLSKAEEAALKDWIAGGKQGPPPVKRDGALRDSLGSSAMGATKFQIDGKVWPGAARPASDFEGVSVAALQEFIRRREADAASLRDNYATGASALVDVVSGGFVRNLAASVINQEIDLARRRLGDIDRFSGADRDSALRDFKGDPLAFDRIYESSQMNLESVNRMVLGLERIERQFERGIIIVDPSSGGG